QQRERSDQVLGFVTHRDAGDLPACDTLRVERARARLDAVDELAVAHRGIGGRDGRVVRCACGMQPQALEEKTGMGHSRTVRRARLRTRRVRACGARHTTPEPPKVLLRSIATPDASTTPSNRIELR